MAVFRVRKAEQRLQIHLPGSRAEKIPTPHHLGNTGFPVIHGDSQLVHIYPIGTAHHKIAAIGKKVFRVSALNFIIHRPGLVRNPDPPGGALPKALRSASVKFRQVPA